MASPNTKMLYLKNRHFHGVDSPATIFGGPNLKLPRYSIPSPSYKVAGITSLPHPYNSGATSLPMSDHDPEPEPEPKPKPEIFKPRIVGVGHLKVFKSMESYEMEVDGDAARVRVDLPGVRRGVVEARVENKDVLMIVADNVDEDVDEYEKSYLGKIRLPPGRFKVDQIRSSLRDGVLKVVIPKI